MDLRRRRAPANKGRDCTAPALMPAPVCHFVVTSPGLHALLHLHLHRCSFYCEQPSSLGYRIAARETDHRLANRHSIPCCWSHALDWCQFPRANRFLRQQGLRTCARAPSATHACAKPTGAALSSLTSLTSPCRLPFSLSSAHLTLVNRFHDATIAYRSKRKLHLIPSAIRNPQSAIYPPSLAPSRLTPAAPEFESHQRHRDCPSTTSATATQHERQIPEDVCALNSSTTLFLSGPRALRHPRTHHPLPLLFFQHRAGTP
jgi:hypothetical protein